MTIIVVLSCASHECIVACILACQEALDQASDEKEVSARKRRAATRHQKRKAAAVPSPRDSLARRDRLPPQRVQVEEAQPQHQDMVALR